MARAEARSPRRSEKPLDLDDVLAQEREAIRRAHAGGDTAPGDCGLALSGGGIRSATFNLGVIQALCELRWLRAFDYLSTVSGGGYIGTWLTALIHRVGHGNPEEIEEALSPNDKDGTPRPDHPAVRYLRDYTNYLAPHRGLLSGDTWMAIATYLRNFELNLACVILLLAFPLIALRLWVPAVQYVANALGDWLIVAVFLTLLPANIAIALSLPSGGRTLADRFGCRGHVVAAAISACAIVGAILLSYFLLERERDTTAYVLPFMHRSLPRWGQWLAIGLALYAFQWVFGAVFFLQRKRRQHLQGRHRGPRSDSLAHRWVNAVMPALGAGVAAGILLAIQAKITHTIAHIGFEWPEGLSAYADPFSTWWAASAGGGVTVMLVFGGTVVVHNGLAGRAWSDADREWWARIGGWLFGIALAWTLVCTLALMVPAIFGWAYDSVVTAGGISWLGSTAFGLVLALRENADKLAGKTSAWRNAVVAVAPYVFLVGLIGGLAYAVHAVLLLVDGRAVPVFAPGIGWIKTLQASTMAFASVETGTILKATAVCAAAALLASWRVDVNVFSMTAFYRDRLSRCYLGASRSATGERKPDDFIGLDPADDLPLSSVSGWQRPFPILCATLNLVRGVELAWQDRKAGSFTFTPLHAGFWLPTAGSKRLPGHETHGAYRPIDGYMSGTSLADAMAISGAALSPIMGYHTNPGIAFLLTVFNLRLGRWCGNPGNAATWRRPGPRFGAWCLLRELFGLTSRASRYVYVSDGGHFDNTGLYELVRRRCRFILASDAEHDPSYVFRGLASAIRKCYADFGVVIELDLVPLQAEEGGRTVHSGAQVGRILYPATGTDAAFEGRLLLVKASLGGTEPPDVASYAKKNPSFPHQSTADQFFGEDDFESYRKLGYYTTLASVGQLRPHEPFGDEIDKPSFRDAMAALEPAMARRREDDR